MCFPLAACSGDSAPAKRPLTAQESRGERIFHSYCAQCHRTDSPDPLQGPSMYGLYRNKYLPSGAPATDPRVRDAIMLGRAKMPGYRGILDDSQLESLIAYLKTL